MSRVYIAQLKCPRNHCILACYDLFESDEEATALGPILAAEFDRLRAGDNFKDYCGLCGARELHLDLSVTGFTSLEEAAADIRLMEAEQMLVRTLVNVLRKQRQKARNN